MQESTLPILIVGGGLGGLTTALALGQKGWPVHVLEQAPEIEPIGFGIQLGPNVFSMLERLGLSNAVQSVSHFPSAILMLDAVTGEEQAGIPRPLQAPLRRDPSRRFAPDTARRLRTCSRDHPVSLHNGDGL